MDDAWQPYDSGKMSKMVCVIEAADIVNKQSIVKVESK